MKTRVLTNLIHELELNDILELCKNLQKSLQVYSNFTTFV